MGCDFNLHEDEYVKEDNEELRKMLTKEEIRIEQLENELNDSNEKLVHVCCQYEKCFDLLKRLYESAESGGPDFYDCYYHVEQFIKENK